MKKYLVPVILVAILAAAAVGLVIKNRSAIRSESAATQSGPDGETIGPFPWTKAENPVSPDTAVAPLEAVVDPFAGKVATVDNVLSEMAKAYKDVRSLELVGSSVESMVLGEEKKTDSKSIHVFYARPAKLNYYRQSKTGTEKLIVDGKHVYLYRPDDKVYRKIDFKGKLTDLRDLASPGVNTLNLLDGIEMAKLLKNPKLLPDEKVDGVDTYVIRGTLPGTDKTPATQTIWIGKGDFLIRKNLMQGKISEADLKKMAPPDAPPVKGALQIESVLTIKKVIANQDAPAGTFTFKPPAGAKEIKPPVMSDKSPLLGKQAPDFKLKSLEGEDVAFSSLRGQVIILHFFLSELPPTKKDLQDLQKLQNEHEKQGLWVLGVSMDKDPEATKKLLAEHGLTIQVLHGGNESGAKAAMSYGAMRAPNTAIIGKDGTVRSHFVGSRPLEFLRGELKKAGIG